MDSSSCKITSWEPFLAHAMAHSRLIGLPKLFVKAHVESKTQPITVFRFSAAGSRKEEHVKRKSVVTIFIFVLLDPLDPPGASNRQRYVQGQGYQWQVSVDGCIC